MCMSCWLWCSPGKRLGVPRENFGGNNSFWVFIAGFWVLQDTFSKIPLFPSVQFFRPSFPSFFFSFVSWQITYSPPLNWKAWYWLCYARLLRLPCHVRWVQVSARRLVWDSLDRDGNTAALCSSHPGGFDLVIASDCLFFKASRPFLFLAHYLRQHT